MGMKAVTILALSALAVAHPRRHDHFHYGTGHRHGTGHLPAPTGGYFPFNGTMGTNSSSSDIGAGSPIETMPVMTVTVSPVPATMTTDAGDSGFSSPAAIANIASSDMGVAPAADSSVCTSSSTTTTTMTSIEYVTVTVSPDSQETTPAPSVAMSSSIPDSSVSSLSVATDSVSAAAFFNRPSHGAGGFSYSQGSAAAPTTFATMSASGGSWSSPAASMSSSSSPASSSSSSSSSGASSGGKRGLSYNSASLTDAFSGKGMSWAYNWGSSPGGSIVSGAEFVPMLWGTDMTGGWASAAASAISSGSKHALSFNEPDLSSQSNISPSVAAAGHIKNMNPLAGQVQIGSPAITNGGGSSPPMGTTWLQQFFDNCNGQCKVDFVAFHWYAAASNLDYFKQHVQDVISTAQSNGVNKVWLTEFGATGSDSEVANFIKEATSFLDSTPAVERYAYFMCSDGVLVNGNSLSSLGQAYAG